MNDLEENLGLNSIQVTNNSKLSESSEIGNLIINYLPHDIDENALKALFSEHGEIISVKVVRDRTTKKSLGYGFVKFATQSEAIDAITRKNGLMIGTKKLKVSYARPPSEDIRDCKLYVTNLPREFSEREVIELFKCFGQIIECRVLKDPISNTNKGVAFVQFNLKTEATNALSLNGQCISGHDRPLSVKFAEDQHKIKANKSMMMMMMMGAHPQTYPPHSSSVSSIQHPSTNLNRGIVDMSMNMNLVPMGIMGIGMGIQPQNRSIGLNEPQNEMPVEGRATYSSVINSHLPPNGNQLAYSSISPPTLNSSAPNSRSGNQQDHNGDGSNSDRNSRQEIRVDTSSYHYYPLYETPHGVQVLTTSVSPHYQLPLGSPFGTPIHAYRTSPGTTDGGRIEGVAYPFSIPSQTIQFQNPQGTIHYDPSLAISSSYHSYSPTSSRQQQSKQISEAQTVNTSTTSQHVPGSVTVVVSNLPPTSDLNFLHQLFGAYGKVVSSQLDAPTSTGSGLNGLVQFSSLFEAQAAVRGLHGSIFGLDSSPLQVSISFPRRL